MLTVSKYYYHCMQWLVPWHYSGSGSESGFQELNNTGKCDHIWTVQELLTHTFKVVYLIKCLPIAMWPQQGLCYGYDMRNYHSLYKLTFYDPYSDKIITACNDIYPDIIQDHDQN